MGCATGSVQLLIAVHVYLEQATCRRVRHCFSQDNSCRRAPPAMSTPMSMLSQYLVVNSAQVLNEAQPIFFTRVCLLMQTNTTRTWLFNPLLSTLFKSSTIETKIDDLQHTNTTQAWYIDPLRSTLLIVPTNDASLLHHLTQQGIDESAMSTFFSADLIFTLNTFKKNWYLSRIRKKKKRALRDTELLLMHALSLHSCCGTRKSSGFPGANH